MSKTANIISGLITMSIIAGIIAAATMAPPTIDAKQHECLALNIYHEARGERIEGQIAVAQVTLNRVDHRKWPTTICEVVYQPKQFSWTHLVKNQTPREARAWAKARTIARDVMIGNVEDPTKGAVYYHANYVNPNWAEYMELSKVIGNHLFYTWDGDWNADN
ncbi:MAG: cell wall hydrolase [Bacteroidia bacterium]